MSSEVPARPVGAAWAPILAALTWFALLTSANVWLATAIYWLAPVHWLFPGDPMAFCALVAVLGEVLVAFGMARQLWFSIGAP